MENEIGLNLERDFKRINILIDNLTKSSNCNFPNLIHLQKNLQSPFFNSIKNVYEYVYQQNITNFGGEIVSPEVLANVTAKSTVAILSAAEGTAHPRVIELPKTDQGLGFNVMGGKEQNSPIYISHIIPGGVADSHGGLRRGDQLISINGMNVEHENHETAVRLLKNSKGSVKLVVRFTPKLLDEIEKRFEEQRRRTEHQQHSPSFGRSFH